MNAIADPSCGRASGGRVWDNHTNARPPRHGLGVRGRGRSTAKEVIDVAILPHADPEVSTSPTLLAARLSSADGCPECVTNVETPSSVYDQGAGQYLANYLCMSCGHAWTTSWRD